MFSKTDRNLAQQLRKLKRYSVIGDYWKGEFMARTGVRSIWNGTISFGMVNIPIKIYPAIKSNELSSHYLHKEDMGRIKNERVCKKCNKKLDYEDIVRGYEYEKGKYVTLEEKELERLDIESSKSITIMDFVDPEEIDPKFFNKPYYLAPDDNGEKLYVLLRETLKRTNRVAIAKLVYHDREHLAAIKASEQTIMLDTLFFADEIRQPRGLGIPANGAQAGERELGMAVRLVESMTGHFDPEKYKDTYRESLMDLIENKLEGKQIKGKAKPKEPTNVVDIISKLKASIEKTEGKRKKRTAA
jgi:DNA end-binding protein Ku